MPIYLQLLPFARFKYLSIADFHKFSALKDYISKGVRQSFIITAGHFFLILI